VKTVVENTGCEYEIVSLRGKQISGCIACLGCVKDNIRKVKDDFGPLREKLVEAAGVEPKSVHGWRGFARI